jgi:hypothetical protein
MRLKFSIFVLFSIISLGLHAQTIYLKPHFGLRAGMNTAYTTFTPNYIYTLRGQTHPNFGFFYRIRKNRWVLQPEAQLNVKGGTFKGETAVIRNNFNYFTLQPVLGYIITEGLTAEVAPEFGFRLNDPTRANGPAKTTENSLMVGLRFDFLDIAEDFSLNLRYIHGTTDLSPIAAQSLYNRTFQMSVIYNFYNKGKKKK